MSVPPEGLDLGGHERWRRHDPRPGFQGPLVVDPDIAARRARGWAAFAFTCAMAASVEPDGEERRALERDGLNARALASEWAA